MMAKADDAVVVQIMAEGAGSGSIDTEPPWLANIAPMERALQALKDRGYTVMKVTL